MAGLRGFVGTALGQDADAFNRGARLESDLQELQRKNQARINMQDYAPGVQLPDIALRDQPNLDSSGFGSDQLYIPPPPPEEKPKGPEKIVVPETEGDGTKPVVPDAVGPKITENQDGTKTIEGAETKTGQENYLEGTNVQPSHLTIPDYNPEADFDMSKVGMSGTPDITQVDPESSQFMQSLDKMFANSDFNAIMMKIRDRIATGYGDMLASSPAGRMYGYFFDSPSEVEQRKASKEAFDWYDSDDAKKYFQQNPNQLQWAALDPIGYHKTFVKEAPLREDRAVIKKSSKTADTIVTARLKDLTTGFSQPSSTDVLNYSKMIGFDTAFSLAILGIESDFGRVDTAPKEFELKNGSKVIIQGPMQVADSTFQQMKGWYTNPTNIKKYSISQQVQQLAASLDPANPQHQIAAGILYLKYGEYIGVPKNLLAAGYQGGMEGTLQRGTPSVANDGSLTNNDYNSAVIRIYNGMLDQFPTAFGATASSSTYTPENVTILPETGTKDTEAQAGLKLPAITGNDRQAAMDRMNELGKLIADPNTPAADKTTYITEYNQLKVKLSAGVGDQVTTNLKTPVLTGDDRQAAMNRMNEISKLLADPNISTAENSKLVAEYNDLKVKLSAGVTEAKSNNANNTAVATDNVSSLQTVDSGKDTKVTTGSDIGVDLGSGNLGSGDTPKDKSIDTPAVYIQNPSKITYDMEQAKKTRTEAVQIFQIAQKKSQEYKRIAEIYRISGDIDNFLKYKEAAEGMLTSLVTARDTVTKIDQGMVYLQGMQGLNDLRYGNNTNRLSMVWSMYSGRDVRIVPRSDGKFNLQMDGTVVQEGMSMREISHLAQLQFDSSYKTQINQVAAEKSMKIFDAQLDMTKEQQKINAELIKLKVGEELKSKAAVLLEQIKMMKGEFKAIGDGSGKGIVQIGSEVYLFDPLMEHTKPNGDKYYAPGTKKIALADGISLISGSASSGNPYLTSNVQSVINSGAK